MCDILCVGSKGWQLLLGCERMSSLSCEVESFLPAVAACRDCAYLLTTVEPVSHQTSYLALNTIQIKGHINDGHPESSKKP